MKSSNLLAILATTSVFVVGVKSEESNRIELLYPKGFRVFVNDDPKFYKIRFHGNINENFKDLFGDGWLEDGQYLGNFNLLSNGEWAYQNPNVNLSPGDTLYYYIQKYYVPGISTFDEIVQYRVPAKGLRVPA